MPFYANKAQALHWQELDKNLSIASREIIYRQFAEPKKDGIIAGVCATIGEKQFKLYITDDGHNVTDQPDKATVWQHWQRDRVRKINQHVEFLLRRQFNTPDGHRFRVADYTVGQFGNVVGTFDSFTEAMGATDLGVDYKVQGREPPETWKYYQITEFTGSWEDGEIVRDYYVIPDTPQPQR